MSATCSESAAGTVAMTSPVAGLVTSIVLPWPFWGTASGVVCSVVVASATGLLLTPLGDEDYSLDDPTGRSAKREGEAADAALREEGDSQVLYAWQVEQLVEALASHGDCSGVYVRARL